MTNPMTTEAVQEFGPGYKRPRIGEGSVQETVHNSVPLVQDSARTFEGAQFIMLPTLNITGTSTTASQEVVANPAPPNAAPIDHVASSSIPMTARAASALNHAAAPVDPDDNPAEKMAMDRQVKSLRVAELKRVMSILQIKAIGLKQDHIDSIMTFYTNNGPLRKIAAQHVNTAFQGMVDSRKRAYTPSSATATVLPTAAQPRNVFGMAPQVPVLLPPLYTGTISVKSNPFTADVSVLSQHQIGLNAQKPPVSVSLTLSEADAKLLSGGGYSIHMFAVCVTPLTRSPMQIRYPQGFSLHCNDVYMSVLPGVAKDITTSIRFHGLNSFKLSFYSQSQTYVLVFKIVRILGEAELVQTLRHVTKAGVLQSRVGKGAVDDDIVAGVETVSLKDPYTRCRIATPIRSKHCKHVQCFDGLTFLQLNKTSNKFECPYCYKRLLMDDLIVDGFFEDILLNTSDSLETVQINLDGNWAVPGKVERRESKRKNSNTPMILDLELEGLKTERKIVIIDIDSD